MKNFPHQINDLGRLIKGLAVFRAVSASHGSVSDDGVVGEELARQGVYSFRNKGLSIDSALKAERGKRESNQGFRTAARDLRRFYELLGFVRSGKTTHECDLLLAAGSDPRNPLVQKAWRDALLNLNLDGSHPYRILLRLAGEIPGSDWKMLALCLEPHNDSEPEFQRVLALARAGNAARARVATGTTEAQFVNAMKILPSLGVQLGDISQRPAGLVGPRSSPPSSPPILLPTKPVIPIPAHNRHRTVTSATIATTPVEDGEVPEIVTADLTEAVKARKERLVRHNEIVKAWARLVESQEYTIQENPFDCLSVSRDGATALLVEAKSLGDPGDVQDERGQARDALGQLLYYEELELPNGTPKPIKIAAFDRKPSDAHIRVLNRWGISVIWVEAGVFKGDPASYSVEAVSALLEGRLNSAAPVAATSGDARRDPTAV